MRMEPPITPNWRKIVTPYRVLQDPYRFGFVIEAVGTLPDAPRLWVEGDAAIMHHSPQCFVVLPHLSSELVEEISECDYLFIEERYRFRHTETHVPWGFDRIDRNSQIYTVPVIHTEKIGDIRKIFNALPDPGPDGKGSSDAPAYPPWRMSTD